MTSPYYEGPFTPSFKLYLSYTHKVLWCSSLYHSHEPIKLLHSSHCFSQTHKICFHALLVPLTFTSFTPHFHFLSPCIRYFYPLHLALMKAKRMLAHFHRTWKKTTERQARQVCYIFHTGKAALKHFNHYFYFEWPKTELCICISQQTLYRHIHSIHKFTIFRGKIWITAKTALHTFSWTCANTQFPQM